MGDLSQVCGVRISAQELMGKVLWALIRAQRCLPPCFGCVSFRDRFLLFVVGFVFFPKLEVNGKMPQTMEI